MKPKLSAGWVLGLGIPAVILLWAAFNWIVPGAPKDYGPWGDKFGALNCLFAGVGFVAIVATIVYQHDESAKRDADTKALMTALDRTALALEMQHAEAVEAQFQTKETIQLTKRSLYLDSLIARIDGYTRQMEIYKNHANWTTLRDEQDELLHELSDALHAHRSAVGAKTVGAEEIKKRLEGRALLKSIEDTLKRQR